MFLLHLLERADEISDAGNADVFGGSGGGFGDGGGDGGRAALGDDDAVDASSVGGAEEGPEVVRVFDAIEGKKKAVMAVGGGGEEVFDGEEFALADDGENALVGVGAGEAGELVAWFEGDTDAGGAAEVDEALEAVVKFAPGVTSLAGDADVFELACAGADGLLDGVEAV